MGDLLGFIAPILAIVFWLVGMSKSGDEEKKQQNRPQAPASQRTETRTQQTATQTIGKVEPTSVPSMGRDNDSFSESIKETLQQQKDEQMDAVQEKLQRAKDIREQQDNKPIGEHNAIKDKPVQKAYRRHGDENVSFSVSRNLTKKGIAQGIIMSEVLGPPRAYQKKTYNRK